MRTRSMILFATIAIFIQGLCVLIIWVNGLIFDQLLTEASLEIYTRETFKAHYQSSANYLSYYSEILESSKISINIQDENSLRALNRLYALSNPYVQNLDEIHINKNISLNIASAHQIPQSIVNTKFDKYNVYYGAQCYSNLSELSSPLNRKDLISIKIQEIYSVYGSIAFKGSIINQKSIYGFLEDQDIFTEYPCVNYQLSGYKFQNGTRYQQAKSAYEESDIKYLNAKLSPPAPSKLFMDNSITLVLPLLNESDQFNGFWGSMFVPPKLSDFFEFNSESIKTIFLLNQDGILLSHPYNITYDQLPLYIFNESITGFNEEDWREILSENPQSNCDEYSERLINMKIFCRQNNIFKRELFISIYKFEKYNLYLLRINDDLEYARFITDFQIYIQNSITQQIKGNAYYQLALFVVVSLILLIITYYLFLPIDFIIQSCVERMKNQGTLSLFKGDLSPKNKLLMSIEMNSLYEASMNFFRKLGLLSCQKSFYCKYIENLKPHKKEIQDIQEFLENLQFKKYNIKNINGISFGNQLQQIFQALKECQILQNQDHTEVKYWNSNWEYQNQELERSLQQSQKYFDNLNQ